MWSKFKRIITIILHRFWQLIITVFFKLNKNNGYICFYEGGVWMYEKVDHTTAIKKKQ